MSNRIKYPLTTEGQETAEYLAGAWDSGKLPQYIAFIPRTSADGTLRIHYREGQPATDFELPYLGSLLELSRFQLVSIEFEILTSYIEAVPAFGSNPTAMPTTTKVWQLLLLQELRNAVANDFEVSDYFLTFNTVGTIITGNATINAPFQSGASIYGDIAQQISNNELADKLAEMLGQNTLQADNKLAESIQELRVAIESERPSKVGKVISELGRSLQHGANAAMVVQAIGFLSQVL